MLNTNITTFDDIKNIAQGVQAWGILSSLDVRDCNPELIRSADHIKEYVAKLCDVIDMKRFGDCQVVHFGEDEKVAGFSMVQLIETSLISGHFANKTNHAYIDIFSCKAYDPTKAGLFTQEFFEAKSHEINVLLRK